MAPATKRGRSSTKAEAPAMKAARHIDPVAEKVSVIQAALQDADLSSSVIDMLVATAPSSLATLKNARHGYQDEVIQMIGQALNGIESRIQEDVNEVEATMGKCEEEKAKREAACAVAEADLRDKRATVAARKSELTEDALAFKDKKALLRNAEHGQQSGDADLETTASDKEKLDAVVKDILELVKDVSANKAQVKQLQDASHEFGFDSSLILALPLALTAAVPRGAFANVVLQQLAVAFANQLASLKEKLEAGAPAKAERADAVRSAQDAFEAAQNKQIESAASVKSSDETERASASVLKSLNNALSKFPAELAKATSRCTANSVRLFDFRGGPLKAFNDLVERLPPPERVQEKFVEGESTNCRVDVAAGW